MGKEINIVHYWGGFPIVATSKWLRSVKLVNKCAEHGWKNWLVLSKKPDDPALIEPFIEAGCEIIYQSRSKGNFDLASVFRNFKLLRKVKCDVFHCYNDHTSPIIGAMFARVPVRVWSKLAMSSYYEQGIPPKGLKKLMLSTRITCLFSNRILAISDAAGKEICEQVGFQKKITTVRAPVPLERFFAATGAGIRDEFNLEQSDVVITAVGHFVEVKGWDIAIKAFAKVYKKIPNTKLLLVGKKTSEAYYQKICSLINQYDLVEGVLFAGNRSDIPEILKASDLFIFPSRSEGAGAALIEAMATGLPCIGTDTGGIPEVLENGKNGFLFQRENSDELAEKIIKVISDSELQTRLSKTAQQNLQKFSIEIYVESLFSHYQGLLKSDRR
ncbi:MAG: glycosyltransferase involved in cell wall biosynthesis [Psychromonas sp.]|uniref:glycosyltransferase family 4 protein n=1 Tax=Psychromonas sp. TaxID=1884585 RepID=UPI0039E6412D